MKKTSIKVFALLLDVLLLTLVILTTVLTIKFIRRLCLWKTPESLFAFNKLWGYALRDHYYEPLFHPSHLSMLLTEVRLLPRIHRNVEDQLVLQKHFDFNDELNAVPAKFEMEKNFTSILRTTVPAMRILVQHGSPITA